MQTAVMQSGRHRTNSDLGSPGERKGEEWVRSLLRRAKSESTPAGLTSSVPTCLCPPGDGANTRNRPTPHGDDPCPCRCPGEPTPSPRWWALPAAPAVPRWRRPSPPRPRFLALPADADPPPEHADGGDGFVDIPIAVPGLATWGCHCPDGEALSGSDSDSTAGSEASGVDWRSVSPDPEPDSDDDARTASPCPSPALLPAFDSPPSEEDLHTWALTSIGGRALFPELRPQRRRVRFCPQPEVGWTWSKDEYERGLDEEEQKELVKRLMDGLFAGLACPGDAAGTRDGSRRSAGGFACQ
ncbi:hypothetical protein DFJ74DRAFT_665377 [Hyaloraphidium curvatum]|nr:hypothetical protein DFJ74DRAFT_665377 [Hyaloraphidium curvatum]